MVTREVADHFAKLEPEHQGEGPLTADSHPQPQSLRDKHQNIAAKPNVSTSSDAPAQRDSPQVMQVQQDRVNSTGARTPHSLAVEIEDRLKQTRDQLKADADKAMDKSQGDAEK